MPKISKTPAGIILLLSFYSGFYCLVLEMIWSRYLQLVFGVSIYAVSTVITCFMFGLAVGNFIFGIICDKVQNHRKILMMMIAGIVVIGAFSPIIYSWLQQLNYYLSSRDLLTDFAEKQVFRIIISILFLLVPTTLLGGIPVVLLRMYNTNILFVGKDSGVLYAANTIGSALGAFLTGFVFIRFMGLENSVWMLTAVFLLISMAFIFVSQNTPKNKSEITPKKPAKDTDDKTIYPSYLNTTIIICFGLSGFTSLAYEVYWTKILVLFFRDTVYDFAIVLSTFLIGLFIGSTICSAVLRKIKNSLQLFILVEIGIGISSLLSLYFIAQLPFMAYNLQSMNRMMQAYGDSYWIVGIVLRFLISCLIMLIPTILFGFTLPLVTRLIVKNKDYSSSKFGLITGLNTVGSTIGSLMAGFVLISWLGIRLSIISTALVNIGIGILLLLLVQKKMIPRRMQTILLTCFGTIIILTFIPDWDKLRMSTNILDPNENVEQLLNLKYYNEDITGITSVVELIPTKQLFLSTGRIYIQNTSDLKGFGDHRRLGYMPLFFHPNPQRVLSVGLGAGITLSGVAGQNVPVIDCVEISDGVINAAPFFSDVNNHVLEQKNVNIIREDGRNYIATTPVKYDMIIADIFFPMSAGSSDLFTVEYFQHCRNALNTGGMVCQWLPAHQLSIDGIKIILKSFKTVFPHTSIWVGMAGESVPVIGFIGSMDPLVLSRALLNEKFKKLDQKVLKDIELIEPDELLSFYICGDNDFNDFIKDAPLNTDNNPVIEFINPLQSTSFAVQGEQNFQAILQLRKDVFKLVK